MAEVDTELVRRFGAGNESLDEDIMRELQSILRLHSMDPEDLYYKWEGYSIKMGIDQNLTLDRVRDFKRDLHEELERQSRSKTQARTVDKKAGVGATPRSARPAEGSSVFDILDNVVTATPRVPMNAVNGNATKRKGNFDSPAAKATKPHAKSSPQTSVTPAGAAVPFAERKNPGEIEQTLNDTVQAPEPPAAPFANSRIKLKANTDLSKFTYKPMAMKLSSASEILDDRIDGFMELVQNHHQLDDDAFGNPAIQSSNEVVVVGRIASESSETKLSSSTILLETSRRMGGGLRVPLHFDSIESYDLFPGKIIALRGRNASGEYFSVSEILDIPLPPPAASKASDIQDGTARVQQNSLDSTEAPPLNILVGSGPYTADTNLDFEPFQAICDRAREASADALILTGPFLDTEHPMIASGDIPVSNEGPHVDEDSTTLNTIFRRLISAPLQRLTQAYPSITIIMIPSVRDAVLKHVAWPQDKMDRKELGMPKQVRTVTNPVMISVNEIMIGASSQDILYELKQERCASATANSKVLGDGQSQDILARLSKHLIEQRHFYPIYPPTSRSHLPKPSNPFPETTDAPAVQATGGMLDVSYLALGEWYLVKPDILIIPSALAPFAKVIEGVVVVNPGPLSKRRAAGTLARLTIGARHLTDEEKAEAERNQEAMFAHKVFERARVDILRI